MHSYFGRWRLLSVALLAEGVDRNLPSDTLFFELLVALLAEGVDRNILVPSALHSDRASPSSRRAWIEIPGSYAAG